MRIPDFWKCPECGDDTVKYTRSKNNKAKYLCNGCNKHFEFEFGKKGIVN